MSTRKRAVVLISGGGSNLQAFIDGIATKQLDLDISLVISNIESAYGLERASKAGINTACIKHGDYDSRLEFDHALIEIIDRAEPDIIILAGFMRILTQEFVQHYKNRLVNIHPSLLPKYPGTRTHERVLEAGDEWHGASIHFVVPEVDAGPVILQGRIKINDGESSESLQQRIHKVEHQIYPQAVKWFIEGRISLGKGSHEGLNNCLDNCIAKDRVLLDGETSPEQLQSFDL